MSKVNEELVGIGIDLAGELARAVLGMLRRGETIEPLISTLPPEDQIRIQRILDREETRRQLTELRAEILGGDDR